MSTLFTSTPVNSRFRTPIFQSKDSIKDLDQCLNSAAVSKDIISAPDQVNKPNEIPPDPPLQPIDLSSVKTSPSCISSQETSVTVPEDVEEEDQSMFYTPELFEGENEESTSAAIEEDESPRAATEEMPLQMEQLLCSHGKMADIQPEELLRSEKGLTMTCAGTSDVKGAAVIPERECVSPNGDCVLSESIAEQTGVSYSIGSEYRATQQQHNSSSKSRRLSRSKQKASSRETGKLMNFQGSQPQVITIND